MANRERTPLFLLLKVTLLVPLVMVVVAGGNDMLVYRTTSLPSTSIMKTLSSPNICGCRVRCFVLPLCTAVTAHTDTNGITCHMTNASQPQQLLTSHETAVSYVKASAADDASAGTGEFFVSTAKGNDGSFSEHYCSQESGVPASLSTIASITGLRTSDMVDGVTDINENGIWVNVKKDNEGRQLFFNGQTIVSARSGITFSTAESGTCMRLKANNVLATSNCAFMTGTLPYACMKTTTM